MNKKIRHFVQCLSFLLCTALVVLPLTKWFGYPAMDDNSRAGKMRYAQFYTEIEDTLQGVLIGTSSVHRAWVAPVAYEEQGIALYPLSTSNQPLSLAVSILREAKTRQDIDYAVVDLRGIRMRSLGKQETVLRHCLDNMRPGMNRTLAVKQTLEYNELYNSLVPEEEQVELDAASLYFPFLKYHTRWITGLTAEDFGITAIPMKSVAEDGFGFKTKSIAPFDLDCEGQASLNELQTQILDDLIAYAQEENITLIFTNAPATLSWEDRSEMDAAMKYVEAQGYEVINMRSEECIEEMGLDFSEDFTDKLHLNLKGAVKFTEYLSAYISEEYNIPDMRGQEGYESWEQASSLFWEFYTDGWTEIADS